MDSTLTAAVIGVLAIFAIWGLDRLKERRAGRRVRLMICIEIDENLGALREFYNAAKKRVNFPGPSIMADTQLIDALCTSQLPHCPNEVWDSLAQFIPMALSEREIEKVHRLHRRVQALSATQGGSMLPSEKGQVIQELLQSILSEGNPISRRLKHSPQEV
jgi:hypothetical protein